MERLGFEGGAGHSAIELGIHVARYSVVAELCRGRRVLDVACGEGFGSHLMVTRWGAASVHAVDVSAAALAQARALFDRPEITWLEMDADRLRRGGARRAVRPDRQLRDDRAPARPRGLPSRAEGAREAGRDDRRLLPERPLVLRPRPLEERVAPAHVHVRGVPDARRRHPRAGDELPRGLDGGRLRQHPAPGRPRAADARRGARACRVRRGGRGAERGGQRAEPRSEPLLDRRLGSGDPAASVTYTPLSPDHRFASTTSCPSFTFQQRARPRIVLVADVRGWAFDNISQHIRTHLGDAFEVFVIYFGEYPDWIACLHEIVMDLAPDLVHFFWREYLFDILASDFGRAVCERYYLPEQSFLDRFSRMVVTTSVYDHLYADEESLHARTPYLWLVDGYSVSSERLRVIYATGGPPLPDAVIEDGVRHRALPAGLAPERARRRARAGRRMGGQQPVEPHRDERPEGPGHPPEARARAPARGGRAGHGPLHGQRRADRPTERDAGVLQRHRRLRLRVRDRRDAEPRARGHGLRRPHREHRRRHRAAGVRPRQHRFILPERTIDALVAALRALLADAGLRRRLADENLVRIRAWSWAHQMPKWLQLFKMAAERVDLRMLQRRRSTLAFAATGIARLEEVIRQKEAVIKATEELALERYEIMEHLGREIGARDDVIRDERARVAKLRGRSRLRAVAARDAPPRPRSRPGARPAVGPTPAGRPVHRRLAPRAVIPTGRRGIVGPCEWRRA